MKNFGSKIEIFWGKSTVFRKFATKKYKHFRTLIHESRPPRFQTRLPPLGHPSHLHTDGVQQRFPLFLAGGGRAVRRPLCVGGGGAPVNFGGRRRRAAGPKKLAAAARRG